jgi:hypothetical protein
MQPIEYRLQTPPVSEPLALSEAKSWIKVDHDTEDSLIQLLITTARERCESITGLSLMTQQWVAALPSWPIQTDDSWWDGIREGAVFSEGFQAISLFCGPVRQVDDFSLFDEDGNASLYPAENYWLDKSRDRLVLKTGAPIPQGTRGMNAIEITYTTGYEIVPGALKAGMLKLIAHLYEHRGDDVAAIPIDILGLWQPFKRVRI